MDDKEIFAQAQKILAEITGLEENEIEINSFLIEDLGVESFDLADLNFKINEDYGLDTEHDFFSVEGIVGNPKFVDENNQMTNSGLAEFQRRLPGLEIPEKLREHLPITELLKRITIKHLVSFVHHNLNSGK